MPMKSPVVRDLSFWNATDSESVWEICTPEKNSLYWSIMVSYLLPSVHSKNFGDFKKRLKNLKDDIDGSQAVMDQLNNFNPFKKKHAFHFKKEMTDVLQKLKKKINRATKIRKDGCDVEDMKLAASSKMLNCNIKLFQIDSDGTKNHNSYSPESQSIHSCVNLDTIIIFRHPNTQLRNREKETFGFGMTLQISQDLQEKALTFILKKDKVLKENKAQIQQAARNSENFLISLLKSDVKYVIPRIYKSPYILSKLQNAGYNTNPLVRGKDGLSAFYLCLGLPDSQYMNMLYDYVSNNFYQCDETCRKPGIETIKVLNDLKCAFETDFTNSNGFSSLSPTASQRYKEVLRFNEYQMNVVKIIRDSQQKNSDEIFLDILEEYINFFLSSVLPDDESIQFENYVMYCDYYQNIDCYTSILLLDRLLSIKNKDYSDLVQPLFLIVISDKYFPKKEHDHLIGNSLRCKGCAHRLIPFKYRMNFLGILKNIITKVQTGSPNNNASPNDMILKSIHNIPKDEFLLARLKLSLEIAINLEVNDTQNVLTIFRTLQVFGEVLETSISENFASGFLLYAQLPLEIKDALINIRNNISHYKANSLQGRLYLETQIDLFQKIQEELKLLYQILEPVFSLQRFKMKEFIIKSTTPYFQITEELKHIATAREIWYMAQRSNFKSFMVNIFTFFEKILKEPFPKKEKSKPYFQKVKRIQHGVEALNLVFNLNITFHDPVDAKNLTTAREDFQKLIEKLNSLEPTNDDIKNLQDSFDKYVKLIKQIFNIKAEDTNSEVKCENLIRLPEKLKDYNIFVGGENVIFRNKISEILKPSFEATLELETALNKREALSNIDQVLDKTHISKKNRQKIKTQFLPKQSENLQILEKFSYDSQEKALGEENETTAKLLQMLEKDEYKKVLVQNSSKFGQSLERKFLKLVNRKIEFLIEKINFIEKILIDEDENIRDLVEWGRSEEIKKHIKFLMRQRYVMELDVKLSLEMLLFDCMNIMDKRKDLESIYMKTNNMFVNIDLRNVLSHGNILVDTLGTFLDPDDLPSELITKMLELIEDKKALNALSDLWMKKKLMAIEDFNDECQKIDDIKNCPRWKGYAEIMPTIRLKAYL